MSVKYRDDFQKKYLQSSYATNKELEKCVPCPGSCSCNLNERSNMDKLMIQAWQMHKYTSQNNTKLK